jgi:hypothetical protein
MKADKPIEVLSKEQNNLLRLLDYAVNLVFLEKLLKDRRYSLRYL